MTRHAPTLVFALALGLARRLRRRCPQGNPPAHDHDHDHDNNGHDHDADGDTTAKLSPADQKLADAQKTCPVSDESLGGMGVPIKVEAEGRAVFLCCEACRKRFERNPQKYFAKLDR